MTRHQSFREGGLNNISFSFRLKPVQKKEENPRPNIGKCKNPWSDISNSEEGT